MTGGGLRGQLPPKFFSRNSVFVNTGTYIHPVCLVLLLKRAIVPKFQRSSSGVDGFFWKALLNGHYFLEALQKALPPKICFMWQLISLGVNLS